MQTRRRWVFCLRIKGLSMKCIHKAFGIIIATVLIGISITGCGDTGEILYKDPITITVSEIGDELEDQYPLAFIGIFDDPDKIQSRDALAGGFGAIKNGSAKIDLWYVKDQSPLADVGDYYVALMFGEDQDNPEDTRFFVGIDEAGEEAREILDGFKPYVEELRTLLENGDMTREEVLESLDFLGGLDSIMEVAFIKYNNLTDNIRVNLAEECVDVTSLFNFAKELGLTQ